MNIYMYIYNNWYVLPINKLTFVYSWDNLGLKIIVYIFFFSPVKLDNVLFNKLNKDKIRFIAHSILYTSRIFYCNSIQNLSNVCIP